MRVVGEEEGELARLEREPGFRFAVEKFDVALFVVAQTVFQTTPVYPGKEQIIDKVYDDLIKRYNEKEEIVGEEIFRRIERYIMLEVLDQKWRQHLKDLTELREGIRLRSYGQRNPIHDYKIVAFEIYNEMIDAIKRETGSFLLKLKLRNEEETANLKHEEAKNLKYEHIDNEAEDAETVEESPQRKLSRRERREMERKK